MRPTFPLLFLLASLAHFLPPASAAPKRVKTKGQIATVIPGKILFTDDEAKMRTFNILPDREVGITVKGTISLADLKPGMLVRIEGPLKANAVEGEVAKVTVFSPNDGYVTGIVQDAADQQSVVTGTVKILKDNTLTLLVGKKRITAKLAQDVAVSIDSKDYTLAPTGSLIEADGYETKDGSVNAKRIVITVGKDVNKEPKSADTKTAKTEKKEKKK